MRKLVALTLTVGLAAAACGSDPSEIEDRYGETPDTTTVASEDTAGPETSEPADTTKETADTSVTEETDDTAATEDTATEATEGEAAAGPETRAAVQPLIQPQTETPPGTVPNVQAPKRQVVSEETADGIYCPETGLTIEIDKQAGTFSIEQVGVNGELDSSDNVPDLVLESFCGGIG